MPTFYHGSRARLYFGGRDVTTYTKSIQGQISVDTADVSTLGERAKKYITGLQDSTLTVDGVYDGAASRMDAIVNEALSASGGTVITWPLVSDTIGSVAYAMETIENTYDIESGMGDAALFSMGGQSYGDNGLDRCLILWSGSFTGSSASTAVANSPSNAYGGTVYIQLMDIASGASTLRINIQTGSADTTADMTTVITASYPLTACYTAYRLTGSPFNSFVRVAASSGGTSTRLHVAFAKRYVPIS